MQGLNKKMHHFIISFSLRGEFIIMNIAIYNEHM